MTTMLMATANRVGTRPTSGADFARPGACFACGRPRARSMMRGFALGGRDEVAQARRSLRNAAPSVRSVGLLHRTGRDAVPADAATDQRARRAEREEQGRSALHDRQLA